MLRVVVALAVAGMILPAAPARDAEAATSKSKKKKAKKKDTKRERAEARARAKRNLPRGWTWPASARMKAAGKACKADLDALGVAWKRGDAQGKIPTPVMVPSMQIGGIQYVSYFRKPPFIFDCHLARTLATLGPELAALGVREIKFSSIYRNTKVRVGGRTKNIMSRHAMGFAVDVHSVTDDTGRVAVVKTDYDTGDPLLLAIEDLVNTSGMFRIVLTPKNDPLSHDDHFHIEVAVDYTKAKP